uniref:CSON012003 protein n=1 Tax=Culicoides sonorensis TaxID=179676 RepID=A0A336K130_CULSO
MSTSCQYYSNSKQRRGQYFATILSCGGSFASGAALGWSSPVYGDLVTNEEEYENCDLRFCVSQLTFIWIISILSLGAMLISIFTGIIMQSIGRKGAQIIFLFPIALGWISTLLARTELMLYAGRFFVGLSCGAYTIIIPIYVNEIADKCIRGRLLAWSQFMLYSGILFAFFVGLFVDMFNLDVICCCVVVLYGIGLFFLPESPIYLIEKEETDRAVKAMRQLYGDCFNTTTEIAKILESKTSNAFEDALVSEWKLLFRKDGSRQALYIVIGLCLFTHLSGIYPLIFTLSNIYEYCQTLMGSNTISLITAACMMVSSFICVLTIDWVGRRKLLLLSSAGMTVMACFMVMHLYFEYCCAENVEGFEYLAIVFLCFYASFFAIGLGPVTFVMMVEMFSPQVSHLSLAVSSMINYVLMFCIAMIFYPILNRIALVGVFALITLASVLTFVFVIFAVPETKGKSHEDIQKSLANDDTGEEKFTYNNRALTRGFSFADAAVAEIDIKSYFQN